GGVKLQDRKLSGFPDRNLWTGADGARLHASAEIRSEDDGGAQGCPVEMQSPPLRGSSGQRQRFGSALRRHLDRGPVQEATYRQPAEVRRSRNLLRCDLYRVATL